MWVADMGELDDRLTFRVHRKSRGLHMRRSWSSPDLLTGSLLRPVSPARLWEDLCCPQWHIVRHHHGHHYSQINLPLLSLKEQRSVGVEEAGGHWIPERHLPSVVYPPRKVPVRRVRA